MSIWEIQWQWQSQWLWWHFVMVTSYGCNCSLQADRQTPTIFYSPVGLLYTVCCDALYTICCEASDIYKHYGIFIIPDQAREFFAGTLESLLSRDFVARSRFLFNKKNDERPWISIGLLDGCYDSDLWLSTDRRVWGWYDHARHRRISQAGELSSEGRTGFCYVLACVELVVRDHILAIRE